MTDDQNEDGPRARSVAPQSDETGSGVVPVGVGGTEGSDVLANIRAFMRTFEPPPKRELHCGIAAWDTLRDMTPKDTGPLGLGAALGGAPLYGIPIHVDHGMPAGRWELREDDEVVQSGDIAPDVDGAFYVPGLGFVTLAMRDDA